MREDDRQWSSVNNCHSHLFLPFRLGRKAEEIGILKGYFVSNPITGNGAGCSRTKRKKRCFPHPDD